MKKDQSDRGAYKSHFRAFGFDVQHKKDLCFFHPASETKDLSGFWGATQGLIFADFSTHLFSTPAWMDGETKVGMREFS